MSPHMPGHRRHRQQHDHFTTFVHGIQVPAGPVLTTRGRKSGKERTVPLQHFPNGEDLIVVAANSGLPSLPGWYFNLTANPRARVAVGGPMLVGTCRGAVGRRRRWPSGPMSCRPPLTTPGTCGGSTAGSPCFGRP